MDSLIKKRFTTSEFAKLHNVNKKTLIYYDNIGLFCPAEVHSNGYRYYTFEQNFAFVAIRLLRRMQVPLKEIRKYMTNYSADNLLELLYSQEQLIDKQISEMRWLKRVVENKIETIEGHKNIDFYKMSIVKEKQQVLFLSPRLDELSPEDIMFKISGFMSNCYQDRRYTGGTNGIIMDAGKIRKSKMKRHTLLYYYYLADKDAIDHPDAFCKPEGDYLVAYYRGLWREADVFYKKMVKFADDNKLVFADHVYEEKLIDDMMMTDNIGYTEFKASVMLK